MTRSSPTRGAARLLAAAAATVFLAGAVVYNTWTVMLAVRVARSVLDRPGLAVPDASRVHHAQVIYACTGVSLLALAWAVSRIRPVDQFLRRARVEKLLLALAAVAVPLGFLEIAARPFVPRDDAAMTSIFRRDPRLGWTLRPGAVDRWGDVDVRINERGFRGPVVPYARTAGERRIVYLGDSVTFGYRVARWEDTYPFLVGERLAARDAVGVETINLSVDGYSQWQQAIVLEQEGFRYAPDLVVLAFVLNDVTEMFHLARFGGTGEGYQLRHTRTSWAEHLLARSALMKAIGDVVREVRARRTFGDDVRMGAIQREILEVETLMTEPDRPDVKQAWDVALSDLQHMADACRARDVPFLVVVFPFTVQLTAPDALSAPQRTLTHYLSARGIPYVDLLPAMHAYVDSTGASPQDLFLDHDHLSERGHRVVAELLANVVAAQARPR